MAGETQGQGESGGSSLSLDQVVNAAVDAFLQRPNAGTEEITAALVAAGLPGSQAWLCYQVVPTAFCRVALQSRGLSFSPVYLTEDLQTGTRTEHRWQDLPLYAAATKIAEARIAGGQVLRDLLPVLDHSAEFNAINSLVRKGSKLQDIHLVELLLMPYVE